MYGAAFLLIAIILATYRIDCGIYREDHQCPCSPAEAEPLETIRTHLNIKVAFL